MILRDALHAIPRRLKRPGLVAIFLGVSAMSLMALFQHDPKLARVRSSMPPAELWISAFRSVLGPAVTCFVQPSVWQWTGDGRHIARGSRDVARAFLMSFLLEAMLILLFLKRDLAVTRLVAPDALVVPMVAFTFLAGLLWALLVGFLIATWEARRADRDEALRQMEGARWALLKAQMSPHLLLNSLNGLVQLTREEPDAAARGMRDLAEVYRGLLHLGASPWIGLADERRFLERYLAVEQLRFGNRLRVEWDWCEDLDICRVMPLALQPLVENAVKHGIAAAPDGGTVRIQADGTKDKLYLRVANTAPPISSSPSQGTGVGLRNLKARLELAYGGKARFQILHQSGWIEAELILPRER